MNMNGSLVIVEKGPVLIVRQNVFIIFK